MAPGYLYLHLLMGRTYEAAGDYLRALDYFEKVELGRGRPAEELKPTPEGHRIYDLARQILGNFDMARANVEENSLRPSGMKPRRSARSTLPS